MSFLLKDEIPNPLTLFSGDIILGSPSTSVNDLPAYMKSLYKLRDGHTFDEICLPHSIKLEASTAEEIKDMVIVKGPEKLTEYIEYRETRINQLKDLVLESAPKSIERE